jgi:hypothetical protein
MAGCLADDFFRVAPVAAAIVPPSPVELGQIERAEAPVAAAALAPPAAPPGQIDGMEADPKASMPKRHRIAPCLCVYASCIFLFVLSFSGRAFQITLFVLLLRVCSARWGIYFDCWKYGSAQPFDHYKFCFVFRTGKITCYFKWVSLASGHSVNSSGSDWPRVFQEPRRRPFVLGLSGMPDSKMDVVH